MTRIFFVTGEPGEFDGFMKGLPSDWNNSLGTCSTQEFGLSIVKNNQVDVVVVGSKLTDCESLEFAKTLMKKHPLVNCAMVSDLDPHAFHEATEGYGIFMQIPVSPDEEDALKMVELYQSITGLMNA
ncbi:hypothetical protein LA52FAK_28710 [Desulforhopalus sp. 52FAK]